MMLLALFWSFFQIGLFSIGGGYAAMPLIEQQVVKLHPWLTPTQFADIVTIAEMTPGPIAINAATFVGTLTAGLPGAVIATLGCVVPSCAIALMLAYLYKRFRNLRVVQGILSGLRPAVIAMIASAGISLFLTAVGGTAQAVNVKALAVFLGAFAALRIWKTSPILTMAGAGLAGLILFSI